MNRRMETYFKMAVLAVIIASMAILSILMVDVEGTAVQRVGAYIVAVSFWGGLILEICMICLCNRERKVSEEKIRYFITLKRAKSGVASFNTSREGLIADTVLLVFVIILIIVVAAGVQTSWIIMTTVSILFLSFNMHCLLNGRNYRYIKALRKNEGERTR